MKILNKKNISVLSIITIISIFGYFFYFNEVTKVNSQELLVPQSGVNKIVGNDLISLLLELKVITLDSDIFENKIFLNLKDFSFEIQPRPVGRPNPFSESFFTNTSILSE
jgi:hypothetical protein